jgi:hypothetical protein
MRFQSPKFNVARLSLSHLIDGVVLLLQLPPTSVPVIVREYRKEQLWI